MHSSLKIVVVEDNHILLDTTCDALRSMGHHVIGLDCAESLAENTSTFSFDLLLVDLNLPGESGISLASRIRTSQPDIGIIMLTARNQLADKLTGYENGADIYLNKPTSIEELGAAIQALAKRIKKSLTNHDYTLTPATQTLQGPLNTISLTADEISILLALTRALEHRLEYWQLIESLKELSPNLTKNALEVKIFRLRKKLAKTGASEAIQVIRGFGYQLMLSLTIT